MNGGYIGVILLDPKGGRFGIYRSRLRGDVGWYCFDGLAWHVGAVAGAWRTILWGGKLDSVCGPKICLHSATKGGFSVQEEQKL